MRTLATIVITLFSTFTTPVAADGFKCPTVQVLPATLGIKPFAKGTPELRILQNYLTNLKQINAGYTNARTKGARNQVANCMLDHLVTLPDNNSLQAPKTRADGATWFLIGQEVEAALNLLQPNTLRNKPELRFINSWLSKVPQYANPSSFSLSSR